MKYQKGQILLVGVILLFVIVIITTGLFSRITNFLKFGSRAAQNEQATHLAEAGIDYAVQKLNETTGSFTSEYNKTLGNGTFTTEVTPINANLKRIKSTGFIPNAYSPKYQKQVEVNIYLSSQQVSFNYAVQVLGDVQMENSAAVNGTVYANGNITGANSSQINGDAYAVGTISSPDPIVTGTKYVGQPPTSPPTVDYQFWKDAATSGGTINCTPTCTVETFGEQAQICNPICSNLPSNLLGPKKIEGNLDIKNNVSLIVNGPIWVTGNLTTTLGTTTISLANSFGSSGTAIITDGTVLIRNGATFNPTNATPPGYILIITTSTANPALTIQNNGATAVFYSLEGHTILEQSSHVSALVAKSLLIRNSATLDYDQGLASATFTTGPGGSWQIQKGSYSDVPSPLLGTYITKYYNNPDFTDQRATEQTSQINYDWGTGKPHPSIDEDSFSIVWEGTFFFDGQDYRFNAVSDDGIKIYLDNVLVLDNWNLTDPNPANSRLPVIKGEHKVKIEYKEDTGTAKIKANFVRHNVCYDLNGDYKVVNNDAIVNPGDDDKDAMEEKYGEIYPPYEIAGVENGSIDLHDLLALANQINKSCF